MSYWLFDGLALGGEVKRDPDGLPLAWRLLKTGSQEYTQNGKKDVLTFGAETIRAMAAYQHDKGEKIPIDSRHVLALEAEKAGVEESQVAKLLPHGTAALGYGNLEARDDGLWLTDVEFIPLAAQFVRDGLFRYFSPVLRGLEEGGQPRVSSVALDNVPALNRLSMIAAGDTIETPHPHNPKKEVSMTKVELALRKLLGETALTLSDTTDDAVAGKIEALAAELPDLRAKAAEAGTMKLAAETAKKEALLSDALAKNKITQAAKETLMKLSAEQLESTLAVLTDNAAVPGGKLPKAAPDGEETLTPAEEKMARRMNLSAEDYKNSKKACKG